MPILTIMSTHTLFKESIRYGGGLVMYTVVARAVLLQAPVNEIAAADYGA